MADNIEKNANKFSQSRPENGREFEQMQNAQNQLLQIQAGRQQNLLEQRMADSSIADQNALMRQAAELSAMGGNMQVNQATQAAMGRYGLRPQTTSSSKQIRTPQGIVINNNTTNITTVPANIGGPLQGRPLQFQAGNSAGENSKFKDWINKAFDKQNEQAKKRDREYSRRETSLTKSSNKIMRKLEEFSRDITKKLDPRNIGRTVGGQIGTIFRLFGMGYLAANTGKILDGIKSFTDKTKNLFEWIKGEKKETPEFIKNLGETLSVSFGKAFFGDKVNEKEIRQHGIFWGFYNEKGTGILNKFFNDVSDKLTERTKLAADNAKMNKLSLSDIKNNPLGAVKEIAGYLTEYLSILIGGEKAIGKVSQSNANSEADKVSSYDSQVKDADAIRRKRYSQYGDEIKSAAGASAYITNGNPYTGTYNINNGSRAKRYGNKAATWLSPTALDNKGRLRMGEEASLSLFSDMQATIADRKKSGSFERFTRDTRLAEQYLAEHDDGLIADPNTLKAILGDDYKPDYRNHLVVKRKKNILDKYPGEIYVNRMGKSYILASTFGGAFKTLGTAADIVGVVSVFVPGIGWGFAITMMAASGLCKLLGNKEAMVGVEAGLIAAEEKYNQADYEDGFPRLTVKDLRTYWLIHGNFYATLVSGKTPADANAVIKDLSRGKNIKIPIKFEGRDLEIGPRGDNYKNLIGKINEVGVSDTGTKLVEIELNNSFESLLTDDYLNVIIGLAEAGIIQSTQLAHYTSKTHSDLLNKFRYGDSASWSTENIEGLRSGENYWTAIGGAKAGDALGQLEDTAAAGYTYNDSLMSAGASGYGFRESGERSAVKEGRRAAGADIKAGEYSSQPSTTNGTSSSSNFDVQAAVNHIVGHALPSPGAGQCGTHVLDSLAAGGLKIPRGKESAYMYKDVLLNNGWEVVTDGSQQPGDVEIYDKVEGKHPHGHMQMWTGKGWYSDFGQKGEDPYLEKGSGGKITRLRYTGAVGSGVTPQVTPGSLGQLSDSSGIKSDSDIGDNTSFWGYISEAAKGLWNKSKSIVREKADGTLVEMVETQGYINNNLANRETPVDVNMRPFSGFTRDILRKYSGADYTGGGLAYLDKFGISGTSRESRRVLSSLFDENGKLRVNTSALDPELATRLKNIETELKKGNEIDVAHINLTAAGIDTTISTSRAQSVATVQAMAGLGGRRTESQSQTVNME